MYVIGTAGHIDHGKSALVEALSGVDPDRLQQEKDRGMTIELGFGSLALPSGDQAGIVDVPGHERFIKNMLAGVGGIDVALLVIAADEGVMPQTREHLAILDLLGIERGIAVVSKSDLVEADFLDLVTEEVREVLRGTTLASAPLVSCSAKTGQGLDQLVQTIAVTLGELPAKRDLGRPRLPIDRAFSMSGFGAVVTGTLVDGSIGVGREVEILPIESGGHVGSLAARVRGIQNHGEAVELARPGNRTAINLGGVSADQIARGQVLTTRGWLTLSRAVDVRLRTLSANSRPLRHNLSLTFHCFSSEVPARLRLLEVDEAGPGSEVWAQIRLLEPAALVNGDRFIIRDANDTLGGGVVIDTQPKRHPRRRAGVIADLEARLAASPAETLLEAIAATEPVAAAVAARSTDLSPDAVEAAEAELLATGRLILLNLGGVQMALRTETLFRLQHTAFEAVESYESQNPARRGLAREELRSRLGLEPRLFAALLDRWLAAHDLDSHGPLLATHGWSPRLNPAQTAQIDAYLGQLQAAPYSPPTDAVLPEDLKAYLLDEGRVVDVGDAVLLERRAYEAMVEGVLTLIEENSSVSLAQVRDRFSTSRRYVQALLEHLDGLQITVRRGDERVRGSKAPARG